MPATLDTPSAKRVLATRGAPARHWVGDGFPVHGLFGYSGEGVAARSPFLLLDYAAPTARRRSGSNGLPAQSGWAPEAIE